MRTSSKPRLRFSRRIASVLCAGLALLALGVLVLDLSQGYHTWVKNWRLSIRWSHVDVLRANLDQVPRRPQPGMPFEQVHPFIAWDHLQNVPPQSRWQPLWLSSPFGYGWRLSVPVWPLVLLGATGAVILWPRRLKGGLCRKCGYDLAGLAGGVCPECGTPLNRAA